MREVLLVEDDLTHPLLTLLDVARAESAGFEAFPDVMVKPERKRREYVNGVLARAEAGSSYRPGRRLWVRERLGHYLPNPALLLRVRQADGSEAWQPILEVLNAAWLDANLGPRARGLLSRVPVPAPLPGPVRAA